MAGHIVLVVQNTQVHELLIQSLATQGNCALCFRSIEEAVSYLREPNCPAFVVVFNVPMRRQSDLASVAQLSHQRPRLRIFYVGQENTSAPDSIHQTTISATRRIHLLEKPLNHPDSVQLLRKALKSTPADTPEIIAGIAPGQSTSQLPYSDEFLRRVGMADVPVLLSGETGVGKEVMARRLCAYSARANKPFLKLNCAALPADLAESELFGSAKGAFTGAVADRQGRFETADGGTILLDEIGDMDLRLQTKLLQVLQDGEIQPLGSNRTIKVNVRVLAATHRDLSRSIEQGTFREDLYYRLNVIKILIPPLRERRDEILPLAHALLLRHLPATARLPIIEEDLKRFLLEYSWPGNVRELENVMRRYLVYQNAAMLIDELQQAASAPRSGPTLASVTSFPDASPSSPSSLSSPSAGSQVDQSVPDRPGKRDRFDQLAEASRTAETELLLNALEASRWNRRQAAASLQIEYKAFLYKLQKYGIVESKGKRREISA